MKKEEDLYAPVKALLEAQGYEVKGEVGAVDVMGVRDAGEDPVLVELKLTFSLSLYQQAITRQAVSDVVYIAVPKPKGRQARRVMKDNHALCRRLGLGLITVREDGFAEVHCDPTPYAPRKSKPRKARLLREFQRLSGDPNKGGARRGGLITGYRDDALKCAAYLAREGASKGADVARATGVVKATTLMRDNHYGWFDKVDTGVYALGTAGEKGLAEWWPDGGAPQETKAD
ncbi:hypothetical protein TRM7557_01798 [Tritonibacter multivorans]|uniref:Uncharacterized protein n=1 Tax=Tritonibacter multivorans TaxID=928856 RepID=A0A0P1G9P5_9RHOB|nr:DUF2161 family putative PD-(D/E)XK-type phosphodiesterase [Tritonibacter multivorans]MDA7422862.1 DUF2161 family putative PD-(D/E)XK-type phosphodiesterase [Tritonibacter multivorans]CUH78263.1 hypothetical protein TRM7557_01798 [Tritonibacter multivorans]SFD62296.1 hypothetical protein SAMN04488049_11836 [Tritonibacter multivorans]